MIGVVCALATILMCGTASAASVPFSDVEKESPYYEEIMYCRDVGITCGVGGNRFAPDSVASMTEVCTMLLRAYCPDALDHGYTPVELCYMKGWLGGYTPEQMGTGILLKNLISLLFHADGIPIYTGEYMETAAELGVYPEGEDGDRLATRADCAHILGLLLINDYTVEWPEFFEYMNVRIDEGYEVVAAMSMDIIEDLPESILRKWNETGKELVFGTGRINQYIEETGHEGSVAGLYYHKGIELVTSNSAVHEFGHFVYYTTEWPNLRDIVAEYYDEYRDVIGTAVSKYALTNEREFFAECFELYYSNDHESAALERFVHKVPGMYELLSSMEANDWGMKFIYER